MAKKIRFPLEMENGVEVRSMEDLRNNFSLSRIIGYINDGRLVTWLQDRYENSIAEAIAEIDVKSDDVARKICDIFDVAYDDSAAEEIEKAEERKRKMELLKSHPDCMEYAKSIDIIAFDQDDLYDLLDEDAEEIYLCGEKFNIPVAKGNTKYVGIIDGVEVVIESKQIVDFSIRSISFVNCKFDEKYNQLLQSATGGSSDTIDNSNIKADSTRHIDLCEINDFAENILETLQEFINDEYENKYDELYEYDDSIECDAEGYNDSGYPSKAKAKAACKEELTKAIVEVKDLYEAAKKEIIETTDTYYRGLMFSVTAFLESVFYESCDALLDVYCTGDTRAYIEDRILELKKKVCSKEGNWDKDIANKCKEAFEDIVKSSFETEERRVPSLRDLFESCEYEEEGEGDYSFDISDACEALVGTYEGIIQENEKVFPNKIYDAYVDVLNEYVDFISSWIASLEKETY